MRNEELGMPPAHPVGAVILDTRFSILDPSLLPPDESSNKGGWVDRASSIQRVDGLGASARLELSRGQSVFNGGGTSRAALTCREQRRR